MRFVDVDVTAFGDPWATKQAAKEAPMPVQITSRVSAGPLWISLTSGEQLGWHRDRHRRNAPMLTFRTTRRWRRWSAAG